MSNYVIALGGTGVRVLRSIVHLCDCGHIDVDELKVLIVDPDITNGSKDAVRQLITDYNACRDDMQGVERSDFPLFKTKITRAVEEDIALTPVASVDGVAHSTKFHIKDLVSRGGRGSDAEINFMKALYSRKEYAELNISEGFFAHPSIGALAFARWLEESTQINDMLDEMRHDIGSKGEEANIFIIASSFGGTGASGFPAMATKIKKALHQYPNRFHIAGVFLLPYFSFMRKKGGDQVLDPKKFLESAKNAMMYYREYEVTTDFDKIYVLGAPEGDDDRKSLKMIRNKYADKGAEQDNWPHILELYAALAAKECFSSSVGSMLAKKSSNHVRNWVGISLGKHSFYDIKWEDFPSGESLRLDISKLLLFNYIFIPAVLNEFVECTPHGIRKKSLSKDVVNWPSIKRAPFLAAKGKGKGWDEEAFGDNVGLKKFDRLLKYFDKQSTWLYRLLTAYEHDEGAIGTGDQLFAGLFGHQMLKSRYITAREIEGNNGVDFSEVTSRFIKDHAGSIGAGGAFISGSNIAWSDVYSDIYNCVHKDMDKKQDLDYAVRQMYHSIYKRISARIS